MIAEVVASSDHDFRSHTVEQLRMFSLGEEPAGC